MITEKLQLTRQILEDHPETRGDGYGNFLNVVTTKLFGHKTTIDFNRFSVESWTRAKRKVLEQNPHLDNRTYRTAVAEETVKREVAA